VPPVIGRLKSFCENASSNAPTGLARSFSDALSTSPTLKKIVEMLKDEQFSLDLLYWFILSWFVIKDLISSR
ncbi:8252_t:CDS:1, partial [Entrophospora sp. SA101]